MLSWQQEEEARKAKEEDEASMYKYKSQVHGDERSEEEQLEAELKATFPQYQQVHSFRTDFYYWDIWYIQPSIHFNPFPLTDTYAAQGF